MRALLLVLLCSCLSQMGCAQSGTFTMLDGRATSPQAVEQSLLALLQQTNTPGLSVAIIRAGKTVYAANLGAACKDSAGATPVTPATIFRAASISKPLFASVVLTAVRDGRFNLDTPLASYLPQPIESFPDYTDLSGEPRFSKLTPRLCLSHTTGLPNWRWILDDGTLRFHYAPGERFEYSGEGIQLAQLAFEFAMHDSLNAYTQRTFFRPLGITNTSFKWDPSWASDAACAHYASGEVVPFNHFKRARAAGSIGTNAAQLAKWLEALLNNTGPMQGVLAQMMTPQTTITSRQMFGPNRLQPGPEHAKYNLSWGLGWGIFQSAYGPAAFQTGHDDGVQNLILVLPDQKSAVIIMTNGDNFEPNAQAFIFATLGQLDLPLSWLYGS